MATAKNTAAQLWAAVQAAQDGSDVTHLSVWDALTSGNWLFNITISNDPDPIATGGRYRIAANGITITRAKGTGESDESAIRSLKGLLSGSTYWQLHTADPGTSGTTSPLTGVARLALADSDFTFAA